MVQLKGKFIQLKKRSGGFRLIFCPSKKERIRLKKILKDLLNDKQTKLKNIHGFVKGKNIITNAEPHINKKITISFDLENFFNTVSLDKVGRKLPKEIKENCFVDGIAYQGLPTSPAIANIVFYECDLKILDYLKDNFSNDEFKQEFSYTRYADDISISFNNELSKDEIKNIIASVTTIISRHGFRINNKKTKVQLAKNGKREICGVYVDDESVSVNRKAKRKLRALKHNFTKSNSIENSQKYEGYLEFCKLKKPSFKDALIESQRISKYYKLKPITKYVKKLIPEEQLTDDVIITNDPCYFLGMSSFTTGWSSCMSLNSRKKYDYRKGASLWYLHPGVSLAIQLDDNTRYVGGIKRQRMINRCLVYSLENGKKAYGKIYPSRTDNKLKTALEKAGYVDMTKMDRIKVNGVVPYSEIHCQPYYDNVSTHWIENPETHEKELQLFSARKY